MATQTLQSDPFQITSQQLPGLTKPLNFKTVTTFDKDSNGKIIDGTQKTILQYQVTPGGVFQTAATSTEGGKAGSFTLTNAANSNTPILGASAIQSLQTPNGVLNQATQNSIISAATKANIPPAQQQAIVNKLKNTATPGGAAPGTGAAAAESADATDIVKTAKGGAKAEGRNTPGTYGNLIYPIDIRTTAQDVIRFTILTFLPTGLDIAQALKGEGRLGSRPKVTSDTDKRILGTIILPIPGNISDTNSCNWGDDRLDAFNALLSNTALTTIRQGFGAGVNVIGQTVPAALATQDTSRALSAEIAAQAAGGKATTILGRTDGAVFNENLELLFSGPELRSFSFTFKMSARSKTEANEIVKIIRAFKQSMSAQTTESSIFLKAPNTYEIAYLRRQKNGEGGTVHTRLGKIKECALLSLTTNYAPEGQYAVYNDGTPISYEIQMQFKELEPVFNVEYGDETKDIGF